MKRLFTITYIAIILTGGLSTLAPAIASAAFGDATTYVLLAPIPGTYDPTKCSRVERNTYTNNGATSGNGSIMEDCETDFITYIKGFFRLIISLSSIIAVLVITFEGFKLVISTSEGARDTAKERIQQALIGLGLVLGSYLILNTINPQLTKISFLVSKVPDDGVGSSAYLQQLEEDGVSSNIISKDTANKALQSANREAEERISGNDTIADIQKEIADLGDCGTKDDPEGCYAQAGQLELDIKKIEGETYRTVYVEDLKADIAANVTPLLTPPATDAKITAAVDNLGQSWVNFTTKFKALKKQGRDAEAETLRKEAIAIRGEANKAINERRDCPRSNYVPYTRYCQ